MAWSGLLGDLLLPHVTPRGMPLARVITEHRKREDEFAAVSDVRKEAA